MRPSSVSLAEPAFIRPDTLLTVVYLGLVGWPAGVALGLGGVPDVSTAEVVQGQGQVLHSDLDLRDRPS